MASETRRKKSASRGENLLLLTGFSCNNNCLMCSIKGKGDFYPDRSRAALEADLKAGRKAGFDRVEFTGGETTIRRDILDLVATAKKLGYRQIALSTNGRLFSYPDFCRRITAAGLDKVTFSLLGPDKKIHEALTRTPGSFDELIAGVRNLQKFPGVHLNVSSVISRLNYKPIKKFGRFVQALGIRHWYLLDLIPDGNAKKFYDILAVPLPELSRELNQLVCLAGGFEEFGFFDFPLCLFKPELRSLENVCLVNAKTRLETSRQVGYRPRRIEKDKTGGYSDVYRRNVEICRECRYYKECGGVWKDYLERYGDAAVKKLAAAHGCQKQ